MTKNFEERGHPARRWQPGWLRSIIVMVYTLDTHTRKPDTMSMEETIGKRIARLRQAHGFTQEQLAERAAVSRVAVSHIEMDISLPGERTVTLLAGVFKCTPPELVAETTYPQAKADRLPAFTCCYTEAEHQLGVLENDLAWLERLRALGCYEQLAAEIRHEWLARLGGWVENGMEKERVTAVREKLLGL